MSTTISFERLFSKFLQKIEGYDLFLPNITKEMRIALITGYFETAVSEPYVRRLFSAVLIDEPTYIGDGDDKILIDGSFEFSMNDATDEKADSDFVLNVIALGMARAWVDPKVNSATSLLQLVGTSDEKWTSQALHMKELSSLRESLEIQQRNLIRDRGFIDNDYLKGKSKTSGLRG